MPKVSHLPDWRPPQGRFVAAALLELCLRQRREFPMRFLSASVRNQMFSF